MYICIYIRVGRKTRFTFYANGRVYKNPREWKKG